MIAVTVSLRVFCPVVVCKVIGATGASDRDRVQLFMIGHLRHVTLPQKDVDRGVVSLS
jgi:hypothetical protein